MANNTLDAAPGERNYAMDLLRVIAMFMIVIMHVNHYGGLLYAYDNFSANNIIIHFVMALSDVAVNIYVLISGYYLIGQKFKLNKLTRLLAQVWFYSWVIGGAFILLGRIGLFSTNALNALMPLSYRKYWFVNAYIGMYVLAPFIGAMLNALTREKHLRLIAILVLMTVVWSDIALAADPMDVREGFSLIWFIVLFIIAAYIRKYGDTIKLKRPFIIYVAACAAMLVSWIALKALSGRFAFIASRDLTLHFYRYNSIFALVASVALFTAFLRLRVTNARACKLIKFISPLTFGVYLIHENGNLRPVIWRELFDMRALPDDIALLPKAALVAFMVFIGCLCADFARASLFRLFGRFGNFIFRRR